MTALLSWPVEHTTYDYTPTGGGRGTRLTAGHGVIWVNNDGTVAVTAELKLGTVTDLTVLRNLIDRAIELGSAAEPPSG